jgi:hypothetical protein
MQSGLFSCEFYFCDFHELKGYDRENKTREYENI